LNIISASRRTDIPAFYSDWFMKRLDEGFVKYKNPFNQKIYSANISPNDVLAIVFWSKDFNPLIKHLDRLDKNYRFYFHFTITGHPKIFEHSTPSVEKAIDTFKILSERYSPYHVIWRFDPIIFSNVTPLNYYIEKFNYISNKLKGYTHSCYFSFVQAYYSKVRRQFAIIETNSNIKFMKPSTEDQIYLLNFMKEASKQCGMILYSCCQNQFADSQIKKASCIDKHLLEKLFPNINFPIKKNPTRKECGCYKSIDVGAYDTCPHGCVYCYANINKDKALNYFETHQQNAVSLYF